MQLAAFMDTHVPALERDEVRNNLILGVMTRAAANNQTFTTWTLGDPGACAIMWPGRPIILGDLTREQCHVLAEATREVDYSGVVGVGRSAEWFAEQAEELGITFADPVPQSIHVIRTPPQVSGVPGLPRPTNARDGSLLADWLQAFGREAVPNDPPTPRAALERAAAESRHTFWMVDDVPVSVAGVARRLRTVGAIAPVYTPPAMRGQGFGGAVTASVASNLFAEGKTAVCLYVDLRNPASNRCYAKLGFERAYDSFACFRE
jgi:RimJ/RimL family protein N-acetyltransferase